MITIRPPTPTTPEPAILGHHASIALRQIGPKSAFLTNRIGHAYARHPPARSRSLVHKKTPFTKVNLKLKDVAKAASPKPASSPTPDTNDQPVFRSLSCEPRQQQICILAEAPPKPLAVVEPEVVLVPTAPASLAPDSEPDEATEQRCALTLEANCELERTVATDEMRESINKTLKGLHAGVLCTWRQMVGAVILLLMQRKIPMDAIRMLTQDRYKIFDVKGLYYGDFLGRWVHVDTGTDEITGTVRAYHAFDGFLVEHLDGDEMRTVVVGNNTDWWWASAPAHGDA
jgi:hypothetical protein